MRVGASPFGRAIRLVRDGDRLPLSLGKPVFALKLETMFIGGMSADWPAPITRSSTATSPG